jgi:hypothetical protein
MLSASQSYFVEVEEKIPISRTNKGSKRERQA